jgi:hypothetical protein
MRAFSPIREHGAGPLLGCDLRAIVFKSEEEKVKTTDVVDHGEVEYDGH